MYTGGSNCDGYTIWTSSNSETYGNTSANSMCMSVPVFGGLSYTGNNRYTGGCLSSSDLSTANTYIANLYTFYSSANTLYTNQQSTINSGSGSEGETMLTKFYNQISDYNTLASDFSTFLAYINAFETRSTALKSCSIFRTDMLIFSNTICFKTVQGFVDQTVWLCMMGPFLCLMSICMFAAIRCPLQKDEDQNQPQQTGFVNNNQTAQQYQYQPQQQGYPAQGQQFQNVDYNPGAKYQTGQQLPPMQNKHGLDL